jgi:hypothetical protein
MGCGSRALYILNLRTGWKWVVSFMLWQFYTWRKSPWYTLDRRLGGPQSWSGGSGEDKIPCPFLGHPKYIQTKLVHFKGYEPSFINMIKLYFRAKNIWTPCVFPVLLGNTVVAECGGLTPLYQSPQLRMITSQFHTPPILTARDPLWSYPPHQNSVCIPCLPILETCPAHHSLLHFTILTTSPDLYCNIQNCSLHSS